MPIQDQSKYMLKLIHERTEKGLLDWIASIDDDAYILSFAHYSLQIKKINNPRDEFYSLEIMNKDGDIVDVIHSPDEIGVNSILSGIYEGARRKAHNIDQSISEIISELQKTEITNF